MLSRMCLILICNLERMKPEIWEMGTEGYFPQVLERRVEWQNIEVLLRETNKVVVHDILGEMEEELEFKDRVINLNVGFGYLVVTTAMQCCIYSLQNLNTPHIFDLKETVNYVQLSDKSMIMVDGSGMQVSHPLLLTSLPLTLLPQSTLSMPSQLEITLFPPSSVGRRTSALKPE